MSARRTAPATAVIGFAVAEVVLFPTRVRWLVGPLGVVIGSIYLVYGVLTLRKMRAEITHT